MSEFIDNKELNMIKRLESYESYLRSLGKHEEANLVKASYSIIVVSFHEIDDLTKQLNDKPVEDIPMPELPALSYEDAKKGIKIVEHPERILQFPVCHKTIPSETYGTFHAFGYFNGESWVMFNPNKSMEKAFEVVNVAITEPKAIDGTSENKEPASIIQDSLG